jgi:hypothetical protein
MNIKFRTFKNKRFMLLVTEGENPTRADAEQVLLDHLGKSVDRTVQLKAELCCDDSFNNYIRIEI